jgi:hypothetical protein
VGGAAASAEEEPAKAAETVQELQSSPPSDDVGVASGVQQVVVVATAAAAAAAAASGESVEAVMVGAVAVGGAEAGASPAVVEAAAFGTASAGAVVVDRAAAAAAAAPDAATRDAADTDLIPEWAQDFMLLSIVVAQLSGVVVLEALILTDEFGPGWKAMSSAVCGIMRSPVSIDSAIAMRLTVQIFIAECGQQRNDDQSLDDLQALRNGLEDPALMGAAQPLLRLLFKMRGSDGPGIDIRLVFLRCLLQIKYGDAGAGRPKRAALPFGTHRDYMAAENKPDGSSTPGGQVTSVLTSLQSYESWWSVEGLSLFASTFVLKPILKSVLTDHRHDAKTACAISGIGSVTGWLPLAVHRYVHVWL